MDEEKDVQTEQTSTEETTSTGEETTETTETTQPQPLTEERVQQMISEVTVTAREAGRREMQGIKDREVAAAERRVRQAEAGISAYKTSFDGLDEDSRNAAELARLRVENQGYQSEAQLEAQTEQRRQQEEVYFRQLDDSLKEEIESWGVDPTDTRIDWAKDAPDYFAGRKRFSNSLQNIVRGDKKMADDKSLDELKKSLKAEILKDMGYDSVEALTSKGAGEHKSQDKIIADYGDGLVSREEYEKAMKAKGLEP